MNLKIIAIVGAVLAVGTAGYCFAQTSTADLAAKSSKSQEQSYILKLNYSNGVLSLQEINLVDQPSPLRPIQPAAGWRCDVVSNDNAVIHSFRFALPSVVCSEAATSTNATSSPGGCVEASQATFQLEVPYYDLGKGINILTTDGVPALFVNTIGFAKLCGDDVCQSSENNGTCAKDCRSGVRDGYCDGVSDGTCDADCKPGQDKDCKSGQAGSVIGSILLILVAIGGIVGVASWWKRRPQTIVKK